MCNFRLYLYKLVACLLLTANSYAATIYFTGFELSTGEPFNTGSGTRGVQSSITNTGTYAYRSNPTTTALTTAGNIRMRSSATNSDTTTEDINTSYVYRQKISDTDPSTATAWTSGGVDAVEGGVVETAAVSVMRATLIRASVLYEASNGVGRKLTLGVGQ